MRFPVRTYDKLLAMFNDTMQGRKGTPGYLLAPKFLSDSRRGLFNDQAWVRRIAKAVLLKVKISEPVIQLESLTPEEILMLLQHLADVHATHDDQKAATTREFKEFVKEIVNRLGAEALLTPAEIIRDFISILNILQQNPETSFSELIHGFSFRLLLHLKTSDVDGNGEVAEFTKMS